jgi:methylase of polypeptide subunit release factors
MNRGYRKHAISHQAAKNAKLKSLRLGERRGLFPIMSHGTNFSRLAADYAKKALVQRSAAETLMGLLGIGEQDDVLDLGCGTGHLTKRIRA